MRFRRLARARLVRALALVALAVFAFGMGQTSAQPALPDGVFVRDSAGTIWLIIGGQRAQVPFYPAGDDVIASVADSGQWVVPGEGGILTLGAQPDFVNQAPVSLVQGPTVTPTPSDPVPTVTIQVDDDRARAGQTVSITLIATDNSGINWMEWEGTILDDNNSNDNKATGDSELDGSHRHDCDNNSQCAFVWQATPTKSGSYKLRARARDDAGNRSEWTSIDFRVTGTAPTATPLPQR
jgi:hypothetical protein